MSANSCKAPFCQNFKSDPKKHTYCSAHRWERDKYKVKAYKEVLPYWCVKRCDRHGYLKQQQVYINPSNKSKICIQCRDLKRPVYDPIKGREYNEKYSDRRKDRRLKKRYQISLEEYNSLLLQQSYCCAICKIHILEHQKRKGTNKNFAVDHCHINNKIRGLLCYRCNMGLGYFQDDSEITQAAFNYLDYWNHAIPKVCNHCTIASCKRGRYI